MTLPTVSFPALGTTAVLVTDPAADLGKARSILEAELAAVDITCSRFRDDSELMAVNDHSGGWQNISPRLVTAIKTALIAAEQTDGVVDPTVGQAVRLLGYDRDFGELEADGPPLTLKAEAAPGWRYVQLDEKRCRLRLPAGVTLDLGATAKAEAADRAAQLAARSCGAGVLVSLGGDIAMAGAPPKGGWNVEVADDHRPQPGAKTETICFEGGGIATSSMTVRAWTRGGKRLHHVVNPSTGWPADGPWRTVTTAAATCVDANTAATASLVRGETAVPWLEQVGFPARLVSQEGKVKTVAGWPTAS